MIFFRASLRASCFENFDPFCAEKSPLRAAKLLEGIFRLGHLEPPLEPLEEFDLGNAIVLASIISRSTQCKTAPTR